jgi:ATP-dependent 26S proteasome regulatory subunit
MMLTSKKVARVLSGGFLLFLGLLSMPQVGDVASAADEMKGNPCEIPHGQNAMRAEQAEMQGTHMISGEVIRVEDANYFVKEQSGKEVSVQTDQRTEKPEINQGDRISAYVDDQNRAVWIRSNKMTDRRTEHASADCVPN